MHQKPQESLESHGPRGERQALSSATLLTRTLRVGHWSAPLLSLVLLATAAGTSGATVVPASASSYLCTGYAGCQAAGYSHAGYRRAGSASYWQMYAGHNCTNYVAYRLVKNGMPNARPWTGSGSATNWGVAMASITDMIPRVGAVAWWSSNVAPAGASGHLAYVEEVISSTEIVVSEDYWGGDFHWRKITKGRSGWPSGFIHFNDVPLEPTTPPAVTGAPAVGQPLAVLPGTWAPTPTGFGYRWLADGAPIAGAASATYTPTPDVRGKTLTAEVTAHHNGFAPASATATTAAVRPGTLTSIGSPTIEGIPEVDQVLTLGPPAWSPEPERRTVQWYADGAAVPGATGPALTLGQREIDKQITAVVTAKSRGYKRATVITNATPQVLAGTIAVTTPLSISGYPRVGRTLTVQPGIVEPTDTGVTYSWMRDGEAVPGATGSTYTLRARDIGRRISVHAEYVRSSYRNVTTVVKAPDRVTTVARLRVRATGKPGRTVVRIRAEAPGVRAPSGALTVRVGGRRVAAELHQGRSRLVVPAVRAGTQQVVVRYSGTKLVRPAIARTTAHVPRETS